MKNNKYTPAVYASFFVFLWGDVSLGVEGQKKYSSILSELRFGVLHHDINSKLTSGYEPSPDINAELLFAAPNALSFFGAPRPHLGISLNTRGGTSQLYLGLSWQWLFSDAYFIEGSLGGEAHNGLRCSVGASRKPLGTRLLFRESVSLGHVINGAHTISLILDHASNAGLGCCNPGITSLGLRYGYRM